MHLSASSIGSAVWDALAVVSLSSPDAPVTVIGNTSHGLFIQVSAPAACMPHFPRIIFVSYNHYRSPLTVTLDQVPEELRTLLLGSPVQVSAGQLSFPSRGITITTDHGQVWQPLLPGLPVGELTEWRERLRRMMRKTAEAKGNIGFSPLLLVLMDLPTTMPLSMEQNMALRLIQSLRASLVESGVRREDASVQNPRPPQLQNREPQILLEAMDLVEHLLGMGRGLTPSGDDVVMGMLLVLNRWQPVLQPAFDLQVFNRAVISRAYQKTTTLSANLIECAAGGEADERLLAAVDYIFTSIPDETESVFNLLELGNSSGVDALLGFTIVLES